MTDFIWFEIQLFGYDKNPPNVWFQTKSFKNLQDRYIVTRTRDLCKHCNGKREFLTNFNDDVIFYDEQTIWIASFKNGRLKEITFKTRERLNDNEILHKHTPVRK